MITYLIGDTIRLTATFRTFQDNSLADPTSLTFRAFDPIRQEITNDCIIQKDAIGTYHVDYTIPDTKAEFIVVEFIGTVEDTPARVAKQIPVSWI